MTQLRAKARASGVYFRVVKNTLVRRAVAETPFASLADKMVGPLAYGIGADPVAVAKVLNDFAKGNDKFVITGGAMPGQLMSAKEISALASLPSRDELIARLLGTMQAPIVKLVRTMNEVPGKFVRTLAAVRDAKAARLSWRNDYRNIQPYESGERNGCSTSGNPRQDRVDDRARALRAHQGDGREVRRLGCRRRGVPLHPPPALRRRPPKSRPSSP